MPNNIRNDVMIKGPRDALARIVKEMSGDESAFDFNKLKPMPAVLQEITTGSTTIDGQRFNRWRRVDGRDVGITDAEAARIAAEHGAEDWYEWANKFWGTKWNAYDVGEPVITSRSLRYRFDTAWASPETIFQALADKYQVAVRVDVSGETYDGKRYSYHVAPTLDAAA